jgi:hypothetical protein
MKFENTLKTAGTVATWFFGERGPTYPNLPSGRFRNTYRIGIKCGQKLTKREKH